MRAILAAFMAVVLAVLLAAGLAVALAAGPAHAEESKHLPVPAVTIYPGDVIREEMLVDRAFAPNMSGVAAFVDSRAVLVGRAARRTLLPGQPIPTNAIDEPKVVTRGSTVKVVVEDDGLVIITFGQPLQSGGVGATVRVRNLDTGVIVTGTVQPDGSVRIQNG